MEHRKKTCAILSISLLLLSGFIYKVRFFTDFGTVLFSFPSLSVSLYPLLPPRRSVQLLVAFC
jgi:hypothetical protein